MSRLFEKLALQAHFRRVFDQVGTEKGWQLISSVVEQEIVKTEAELPQQQQQQQQETPRC